MNTDRVGQIAVIFVSRRTGADEEGYRAASARMDDLAARQPGYCGIDAVRGSDGVGITVSYWSDDAAARAWRDQAEHAATRDQGRERWYDWYTLTVATVTRGYAWTRNWA
ncbi:antibiotic biosynthesis monooxygenase family protein [Sphingomonas aerophila]|jgi:heme-degrading monooxygenase HmoA|uniref:Heme-degrading monooxygenase HmoA n=1 Tax=Sphingomonas aerophila TaxID=1344948 RepID=A0A7W9BA57_9SPHN|nr:antibiotic biosynthesis monooxygenase [Sphingomonas aerophila]MBB5713418.1 heme-degrading monooxygenase HmoA [Sphingomonas aerophila]